MGSECELGNKQANPLQIAAGSSLLSQIFVADPVLVVAAGH